MSVKFLYGQNQFLIALIVFVLLLLVTEIGFRRGRAIAPDLTEDSKSQLRTVQGAVMGLLALLLAFSFAMAESRFAMRQSLVVEEANAIGTAILRSRLLPEPYRSQITALLRQYLDTRIAYHETGIDPAKITEVLAQTKTEESELWSKAVAAVNANPNSPLYALFISSLNDVIDFQAKRTTARENHVPETVYYLLLFVAGISMVTVGLGSGIAKHRHLAFTTSVTILITLVILVIIDLDRPLRGFIQVSNESLLVLKSSLTQ